MKIPRFRFQHSKAQAAAVSQVYERGLTVKGPHRDLLAESLSSIFGYRYAVLTANCSLALVLGLEQVGSPDVSIPRLQTCHSLVNACYSAGKVIHYRESFGTGIAQTICANCDIPIVSSPLFGRLEQSFDPSTGHLCLTDQLPCSALEDAAQGFLARIGTTGRSPLMALSFYPTKFPGGADGGALLLNDEDMYLRIRERLSHSSASSPPRVNWSITNLQAAVVLSGLESVDKLTSEARRAFLQLSMSCEKLGLPYLETHENDVPTRFIVFPGTHTDTVAFSSAMIARGIETVSEVIDAATAVPTGAVGGSAEPFPPHVSLPFYPGISERDIERVCGALEAVLSRPPSERSEN